MGYCGPCAAMHEFIEGFDKTISRGPDDSRITDTGNGLLAFHRLAIMGLTPEGMQPFELDGSYAVCNGEIYGFEKLKAELSAKYEFASGSDCEILLPMYREYGTDMFSMLDAEFAMIIYDAEADSYIAARDPIGIRPLYYGHDSRGTIVFASEPKNLTGLCARIRPFPPGHYYKDGEFICYCDIAQVGSIITDDTETVCRKIREKLTDGVGKRLIADAKVGFLLSGGLDSSLVCAIAARESSTPIRTFAIGMSEDAIDLKYAKQVADYIGSDHTEVIMTKQQVLDSAPTTSLLSEPAWACTCSADGYTRTRIYACCSQARYPTSFSATNTPISHLPQKSSRKNQKSASASCICTTCSAQTAASPQTRWKRAFRSAISTS